MVLYKISDKTHEELEKLTKKELWKLAEILSIGFLNDDPDKDDLILVISTEYPESRLNDALKKLKSAK